MTEPNPYQAVVVDEIATVMEGDVEAIRRKYLNHEASIKSIGILYYVGAGVLIFALGFVIFDLLDPSVPRTDSRFEITASILMLVSVVILIWAGRAIRRLENSGRIAATIISIIGIFAGTGGWIIQGYILYLLLSNKGKMVFSSEYKSIIEQTPHIKYKLSWIMKACLYFLLVVVVLAVVGMIIASFARR